MHIRNSTMILPNIQHGARDLITDWRTHNYASRTIRLIQCGTNVHNDTSFSYHSCEVFVQILLVSWLFNLGGWSSCKFFPEQTPGDGVNMVSHSARCFRSKLLHYNIFHRWNDFTIRKIFYGTALCLHRGSIVWIPFMSEKILMHMQNFSKLQSTMERDEFALNDLSKLFFCILCLQYKGEHISKLKVIRHMGKSLSF